MSFVVWPTLDRSLSRFDRRIGVLADMLNDRLRVKVRQELGATYTPEVIQSQSDAFPHYGYLAAALIVDAKQLPRIGPLVKKIAADLAAGQISDDEFERAMKPMLTSLADLNNGYWLSVLGHCQERPQDLAAARSRTADYTSIKKSEIQALAKQYLGADRATVISVTPRQ